eukprot:scaffold13522_cov94-Phaeocystis_antarctica.AAC.1
MPNAQVKGHEAPVAVGAPESGESPRDWRHSPPGEAAMVDEATTTKWHVKHGPTERRHASQSDASNLDKLG